MARGLPLRREGPVTFRGIAWLDEPKPANVSLGSAFGPAVVSGSRISLFHLSTAGRGPVDWIRFAEAEEARPDRLKPVPNYVARNGDTAHKNACATPERPNSNKGYDTPTTSNSASLEG